MKILSLIMIASLMGCVSPAIGGRTKLDVTFRDVATDAVLDAKGVIVAPASQDTDFTIKVSAAAGVTIDEIASMIYELGEDGAYTIRVNGEMSADTTDQAEALKVIEAMTAEQRARMLPELLKVFSVP